MWSSLQNTSFVWVVIATGFLFHLVLFVLSYVLGWPFTNFGFFSVYGLRHTFRNGDSVFISYVALRLHRPSTSKPYLLRIVTKGLIYTPSLSSANDAQSAGKNENQRSRLVFKAKREEEKTEEKFCHAVYMSNILRNVEQKWIHFLHKSWMKWLHISIQESQLTFPSVGTFELGSLSMEMRPETNNVVGYENPSDPELVSSCVICSIRLANLVYIDRRQSSQQITDYLDLSLQTYYSLDKSNVPDTILRLRSSIKVGVLYIDLDTPLFEHLLNSNSSGGNHSSSSSSSGKVHVMKDNVEAALLKLQEAQIQIGTLKLWKRNVTGCGATYILNGSDFGLNLILLNKKNPSHRMFFPVEACVHQILASALSFNVESITPGHSPHVLLNIPLVTITCLTSALAEYARDASDLHQLQNSILRVNSTLTSPSLDLRLELLHDVLSCFPKKHDSASRKKPKFPYQYFPYMKFSVSLYEPALRFLIASKSDSDFPGMLVANLSSMFLDIKYSPSSEHIFEIESSLRLSSNKVFYHNPKNKKWLINTSDLITFSLGYICNNDHGSLNMFFRDFQIRIEEEEVINSLKKFIILTKIKSEQVGPRKPRTKLVEPLLFRIPKWLKHIQLEVHSLLLVITAIRPEISPEPRGINCSIDKIHSLYLNDKKSRSQGMRKFDLNLELLMIKSIIFKNGKSLNSHLFLQIPNINFIVSTILRDNTAISRFTTEINFLRCFASLLHNCCIFYAYRACSSLFGENKSHKRIEKTSTSPQEPGVVPEGWNFDFRLKNARVSIFLDDDVSLLLDCGGFTTLKKTEKKYAEMHAKFIQIHTKNSDVPTLWDRFLALGNVRYQLKDLSDLEKLHQVTCSYISIRIPHKFIPFILIESAINTVKAAIRVSAEPLTIDQQHDLAEEIKQPRVVPHIQIKSTKFKFEVDDDPFECRLGMNYRIGLTEQQMRIDRWNIFEERANLLRKAKDPSPKSASESSSFYQNGSDIDDNDSNSSNTSNHTTENANAQQRKLEDLNRSFEDFLGSRPTNNSSFLKNVSVDEDTAREKLMEYDSLSWISNIKRIREFRYHRLRIRRMTAWPESDALDKHILFKENIIPIPIRPPLVDISLLNFDFTLDKPSFPLEELPKFLNTVGRGQPLDYGYSIYFPMYIDWKMDEAKFLIRDYPLPLVYIPKLGRGQDKRIPSWHLKSNMVITEQQATLAAIRDVSVKVIPADLTKEGIPYVVNVTRTVSPIKTFSKTEIDVNSSLPTFMLWCNSYQPALSDMTRIMDTFTKMPIDPSEKLGFWDKIRLVAHSQIRLRWLEDGDVFLSLKGSRDPYVILGEGAGFQFCWSGNVSWDIGCDENPANFMIVDSDKFYLTIPDFPRQINGILEGKPLPTKSTKRSYTTFGVLKDLRCRKVIAKLVGKVRWRAGFVPERHCDEDCTVCNRKKACRLWNFKPHWQVITRIPQYCHDTHYGVYDAYRDFRSHYIHCSLALESPRYLDDANAFENVNSYNTIHLTPLVFSHFSSWWNLFSNNMSYPLRSGNLFPTLDSSPNKKFGRHLATFKYALELTPLFISHMYNYKTNKNWQDRTASATGLKARVDNFTIDLHQRSEKHEVKNKANLGRKHQEATSMKVHLAEIDFKTIDLRAISASFDEGALDNSDSIPANVLDEEEKECFSFKNVDGPANWVDIDDYHEADWLLPQQNEKCSIYPLAFSPRFTYYRHTKCHRRNEKNEKEIIPDTCRFGDEFTHRCLMPSRENPKAVQYELLQKRRKELEEFMTSEQERIGFLKSQLESNNDSEEVRQEYEELTKRIVTLSDHYRLLEYLLKDESSCSQASQCSENGQVDLSYASLSESVHAFNNRFVAHNVQVKWNNFIRNAVMSYVHEVERVRGFAYYMSQKAIVFLRDLEKRTESANDDFFGNYTEDDEDRENARHLLKFLLEDSKKRFWVKTSDADREHGSEEGNTNSISNNEYDIIQSYVFRFISPQIQLQCSSNPEKAVIISIQSLQIKILSVVDPIFPDNDINYLIERRFLCKVNESQFFISKKSDFEVVNASSLVLNEYGCEHNTVWPPWVPFETTFDFVLTPAAFSRFLHRVSFSVIYTKHNDLRLQETVHSTRAFFEDLDTHADTLTFDFPRVVFSTDSSQYYDIFTIITDLLLYKEPAQKQRNQRLEEIMLAADFSDLTGTSEVVRALQARVHRLLDLKLQHQLYDVTFGIYAHIAQQLFLQNELHRCGEELYYLIESIAAVQNRGIHQNKVRSNLSWFLMAKEVVWHLLEDNKKPFLDVRLQNATFRRIENSDASNFNTLEIEFMKGSNLAPGCQFENIICPYFNHEFSNEQLLQQKFIRIHWEVLEAVAGIQVIQHFEINLFPLSLQIEQELATKLFAYAFPNRNESDGFPHIYSRNHDKRKENGSQGEADNSNYSGSLMRRRTNDQEEDALATPSSSRRDSRSKRASLIDFTIDKCLDVDDEGRMELQSMLDRAGSNMLITYFKIPSVVLRLSYRGTGGLGLENITGFVFTVPTMEYRNEVCSYLDLAMKLKHDLIRTVVSHTGKLLVEKVKGNYHLKEHEREVSSELLNLQQLSAEHNRHADLDSMVMARDDYINVQQPLAEENQEEGSPASVISRNHSTRSSLNSPRQFWAYHGSRSKKIADIVKRHIPPTINGKRSKNKGNEGSNARVDFYNDERYDPVKRELILGASNRRK